MNIHWSKSTSMVIFHLVAKWASQSHIPEAPNSVFFCVQRVSNSIIPQINKLVINLTQYFGIVLVS